MTRLRHALYAVLMIAIFSAPAFAQQNSQINNLLLRYKNWRYGMVSVYKVAEGEDLVNLNVLLGPKEPDLPEDAKQCRGRDEIESYVLTGGEGMDDKEVQRLLRAPGCKSYERYYTQRVAWERAQFKKAYVVTTRRIPNEPYQFIGLLVQKNSESYYGLKDDLDPPSQVFLPIELKKDLDEAVLVNNVAMKGRDLLKTGAKDLLEFINNQVVQGNYENVTPEAQGIGEEGIRFVPKRYGNTIGVTEDDPQTFIRITEGNPQLYQGNNEVIVSLADGVSYRRYEVPKTAGQVDDFDTTKGTNSVLPKYGAELAYGLEAINYPSLWSERLTLNALWSSSRLGIILPSSGWASIAKDLGNTRKMTNGGLGLNGSFDFPIKVISESGVFNLSASYVFDDAKKSTHQVFDPIQRVSNDYLVRYHGSLQYSFAIKIDKNFMFRMRLGGTVYGMETWADQVIMGQQDSIQFKKSASTTVGGVSGRVDFMNTSWSTPVGFSLSYFDETVMGIAWLQVPVIDEFAIRLDAKIFTPVFRDPRPWENSAVVMPSARFIFNF